MRYLPLSDTDRKEMLAAIGIPSVDDLFREVPRAARHARWINLPDGCSEFEVESFFKKQSACNLSADSVPCFLGGGAYDHHIPAVVDTLIQRGEFLTSYTPYQPEVSQGTLQTLFEFQTQVALITGMAVANASLYDGSTACAEAILMALRLTKRNKVLLSGGLHPHYQSVAATHTKPLNIALTFLPPSLLTSEMVEDSIDSDTACVVVQNPDFFGRVADFSKLADACHRQGALLIIVVTECVSLGLLPSPGEMGADIVAAEGQSLGNSLSFGGPYLGLFACKQEYLRQMPGRLVGQTMDSQGQRGWVLTLAAREQHIRREKATSNICTNSGLCALAFSIHLGLLGETGFKHLAELNHLRAVQFVEKLANIRGFHLVTHSFFNELTLALDHGSAREFTEKMAENGVLFGIPLSRFYPQNPEYAAHFLLAVTELSSEEKMNEALRACKKVLSQ